MAIEEAVLDVTCNSENQDQLVGKKKSFKGNDSNALEQIAWRDF